MIRATTQVVPIKPVEMVEGAYDQFIGYYNKHVPKFLCDKLIDLIDTAVDTDETCGDYKKERDNPEDLSRSVMDGATQFPNKTLGRKDESIIVEYADVSLAAEINQYLQAAFLHYQKEYTNFSSHGQKLISFTQKLQRTKPGGGYHVWHCENSSFEMAHRVLVWSIYLNDDYSAGETEFLWQHKRVKAETGDLIIWPAAWTHQHRGNPPLEGTKYILTGWFVSCPTAP